MQLDRTVLVIYIVFDEVFDHVPEAVEDILLIEVILNGKISFFPAVTLKSGNTETPNQ